MTSIVKSTGTEINISPKILELKKKIKDSSYVDNAVQRIAQVLSRKIVEDNGNRFLGSKNGKK